MKCACPTIVLKWVFIAVLVCPCCSYIVSTQKKHCLWFNNTCVQDCPDWMVEYKADCSSTVWMSQLTCENSEPQLVGTACGFSRCDCPGNSLLDMNSGYCYDIDSCPPENQAEKHMSDYTE